VKSLLSSPEHIVEQIRNDITAGRLAPGTPLRQEELAKALGVSHIPVREALRQLESEGMVAIRPRRGAIVADLSAAEIQELNEMRVALERLALRLAIPNSNETSLGKAEAILDRIDRYPLRWAALNTDFHLAIYGAADRPRLLANIASLERNVERYLHREIEVTKNFAASQHEHRRLLALIKRGRTEEACSLLSEHILEPGRILVSDLHKSGNT
jgi:DNA-binding GntR family transcriptional regulator